ncbi:gamma-tubulin complex component 6 isoform X1 [Salmo salar]|uniref:Gamma-tubulin complex component 6 isoform X1 n=1 Tax=Salmo salar TaxID=8030 RepID=A0A1S3KMV3_SALSA|nr:gamma-tubulin complex component 6 isoform X1 [Salmo salar]XP_013979947.2 gamma-tubulin complex component 6 isoform X1 [Salmo salar]XP_013979948.2 gamma-tubulin complex component 6 isoform X1 [Salmo salar]
MYSSPDVCLKSGSHNSSSNSNSITELLGSLCDSSLTGVSWKRRALGGVSREGVRRTLRKRAYGALLSKLFQEGSPKGFLSVPSATSTTPPRNKLLMMSFDLRVAGCQDEAERLEEQLGRLSEGPASGLKELDSVLELLVQLTGSAPPPPASFSRDYMRRERPVLRRPPLGGYQSEELQRLEARAWALMCGEEWGSLKGLCGTLGLMDAPPGTGLLALRRRSDVEERFEKETRMSLFGALQHSRTSDLDIRLNLPPVPSNADVTGLAIRVPPCLDQLEDEGFQSASNLTPDSQSEPSPSPELDVWDALRTFEPGRRRCWESVGCPPGKREFPYLTEGGREAFDQLYRLWEGEMRVVCSAPPSPLLPLPLDCQTQLVSDLLNVLIGVASTTFPLNQVCVNFDVRPGVCVSGASPESVSRLLGELAQYGTHYLRLSRFVLQSAQKRGLVFQAFTGGLRKYLHYYRACVLSTPPTLSLLTIGFLFRKVGRQLRYLSELCCVDGASGVGQATFPVGVTLLSYLYNEAQSNCSNENYPVLLSLLKSSCEPYTRFVSDWVYSGVFRDVYGEFMIQVNEDYLSFRDKHFWVQGYTLISRDVEDCVPVFLRHIANDVYVCGKTINLLKICCPQHYICWSELPMPRIAVTFSLQEVEEIERDCAVYRGRMERIAKHSATSREEQALRTEQARQELINQVRQSAAKTLESIRGRQVSQRLAEEAKKRERFEELRQHLEQEQEWHSLARRKEQEDEFSFARELRDREKRLQALEEQLEIRARKELIAQYSHLSEEAAKREWQAMWRVQRMRLDDSRAQFLLQDQQETEAILEKYPVGGQRPPLEILQPAPAQTTQPLAQQSLSPEPCEQQSEEPTQAPLHHQSTPLAPPTAKLDLTLVSEHINANDFLPKPADSLQVDQALQEIGSDLPEAPAPHKPVDYDFSAPYSPLEGVTAPALTRPRWGPVVQPDMAHPHIPTGPPESTLGMGCVVSGTLALPSPLPGSAYSHSSDSTMGVGCVVSGAEVLPRPSPHGQASQSSIPLGQYSSDVPLALHTANVHGHPSQTTVQLVDGSQAKQMDSRQENTEDPSPPGGMVKEAEGTVEASCLVEMKPAEIEKLDHVGAEEQLAGSLREASASSTPEQGHDSGYHPGQASPSLSGPSSVSELPTANIQGHASDAHIKVGEHVSDVEAPLPSQNIHGHSSDANIKVGEFVSEMTAPLPTANVHGHASDAHIKVGEHVSEVVASLFTQNIHGHASDSHIKVGEHMSEEVASIHTQNIHGHSSDTHFKAGEFVLDAEPSRPRWSKHGHASDCTLQVGCVMSGTEPVLSPLPGSTYGHSSESTLGIGCVVSGVEPLHAPLPGSDFGHASDSTLGGGCVVSGTATLPSPIPGSDYGHSSDSAMGGGCVISGIEPVRAPLPGSNFGQSSDSTLGTGCVVSGVNPLPSPIPGSTYGHSSDSALGGGCKVKETGNEYDARTLEQQEQQRLAEGISSWAAGLALSPGESSEREYLSSLAAQYQVEQYEDCYGLMTLAPECHPLHQVTRGPWGLPVDPSLRRATDTTVVQLSGMVSLPVLMKHSVTTPLITHVSLVNKAVVDYYFVELGVERHFEALRHFLLMEDGEFAQSLSDLIFEKMGSGQTPGELLTPLVLNSILSKALQYSLHGDSSLAPNFTFALRFLPETFHPHAPDALNCLELRYKVDWPLNIIITDSCMNKYNRLFSFLLQLKHMVWSLRDVWFHLKRTALVKGAGRSVQFRQLQLYRHEMQHFVKVIQGYIANQILQVSWLEFTTKLASASDLDAIHRIHADYLNRAIFRGLLTEKAAPVMNIIHSIFSLILKFRAQLIAQPWDSQQGEAVHPSFIAMQQSYNTFKYYSHFLFKVVTKLVNRGYQPHLEDFLLRINFNNYYKDS